MLADLDTVHCPDMKVICAPDSFKESISAADAAAAMARGVKRADPGALVDLCPVADGGDGTVSAMLAATGGRCCSSRVLGPLLEPVEAKWGMLGEFGGFGGAVIEMAAASGMALVTPSRRDPMRSSTFGTGQLMMAALDEGALHLVLGIGGSASNDGGCGMALALGVRFYDDQNQPISAERLTGGSLVQIRRIDLSGRDPRIGRARIVVACDVSNPLTGPDGAAHVYGPQKGATPQQVEQLDEDLEHLAGLWREQLGLDLLKMPGAGAAGGLGGGLVAFGGASLRRGIEIVLEAVHFKARAASCDLCLTGEGRLDGQSLSGKAPLGVAAACPAVPTVALVGSVGQEVQRCIDAGLAGYRVIGEGLSTEESMRRAAELLEAAAAATVHEMAT